MSVRRILASPTPDPFEGFDLGDFGVVVAECPHWCLNAPGHPDAFDTPQLRHRSQAHLVDPVHGGGNAQRLGRATVSVQVEQCADRSRPPVVAVATEVNGDEQFAHLTAIEARALRDHLDAAVTDIADTIEAA